MARDAAGRLRERRETFDLHALRVLVVGLGTAAFVAASLGGIWLFYSRGGSGGAGLPAPPEAFPPPRLQSDPAGDLRDYQAAQRARLEGYAWADRERGLVRIPIERAMEMIAARGAAAYAPPDAPAPPEARR